MTGRPRAAALLTLVLLAAVPVPANAKASGAAVPAASLRGPVTGGLYGRAYGTSLVDLAGRGYSEAEYFASGVAEGGAPLAVVNIADPRTQPEPYTTRVRIVRRPTDPAAFNGTVLVEWLNVTQGADFDADWAEGYGEMLRGYAYVGVSAQEAGVNALKRWDLTRYGSLDHPGDGYADAMYAQILQAVRHGGDGGPLAGLRVNHVIAHGHSQSGIRLHAFVERVQSRTPVADGFLIRGDVITEFAEESLRTPVLQYQSEGEIVGAIGVGLQRPTQLVAPVPPAPDSRFYRLWQVAGSSHISKWGNDYLLAMQNRDNAGQPATWDETAEGSFDGTGNPNCPSTGGLGPSDKFPQRTTLAAAIAALRQWVETGRSPRPAPRIQVDGRATIVRDSQGNAVGGIRNPTTDVPVATYRGDEGCPLVGVSRALDAAALRALYPARSTYVDAFAAAADRAVRAGWLLAPDAADLVRRAEASSVVM